MEGREEVINKQQQQPSPPEQQRSNNGGQTIIIKGKRTKRQRPQSPIPFRMITSPYHNNDDNNTNTNTNNNVNSSSSKSDEGSDICSNNQQENSSNNNHVDHHVIMTGVVSDEDGDCYQGGTTTTTTTTTTTEEEEDMANCLILLAQGQSRDPSPPPRLAPRQPLLTMVEDHRQVLDHGVNNTKFTSRKFMETPSTAGKSGGYYVYECKTCSKTFPSFQALGGHRASHKKPKIRDDDNKDKDIVIRNKNCNNYNHTNDSNRNYHNHYHHPPHQSHTNNSMVLSSDDEDQPFKRSANKQNNNLMSSTTSSLSLQLTNRALYSGTISNQHQGKPRVHECSICGAEFSSGQALGGHMRRHRAPTVTSSALPVGAGAVTIAEEDPTTGDQALLMMTRSTRNNNNNNSMLSLELDLNLPAPAEDNADHHPRESKLAFASKQLQPEQPLPPSPPQQNQQQPQQQLVFSSPALVDCHY